MIGDPDTVLAFDFGLQRIGVALGNTLLRQAQPLTVIVASTNQKKFSEMNQLFLEWQPTVCVVGVPVYPDGTEHAMTQRCRRFAHQLEGRYGVVVHCVDERYSSAVLSQKRGEVVDDLAAAVILQQYFDQSI